MNTAPVKHVVIVGGGIAGLSAAWYIQRQAQQPLHCTILEQSDCWGGKIQTERIEGFGNTSFILEAGPDALLTRKPWALELARELGLSDRILNVNPQNSRTFVVHKGKLVPLPDGLQLLVPTRLLPFLRSPLFSLRGKLRVLLEPLIPHRHDQADETLADFVRRRLGAEMLDKLADPLLAGVYNAQAQHQSISATFPQFPVLEQRYGSLLRGIRSTQRQPIPESPLFSFQTGTHELVEALLSQLTGHLRLNAPVRSIQPGETSRYVVTLDNAEQFPADAVILATPAKITASLVRDLAPQASTQLRVIRYSSIGALYLGFRRADVPHPLDGFGALVLASERRRIDGMTWMSSKWDCRAPADHVQLRVFFGGPHTRNMMNLDDANLLSIIGTEIRSLLGIHAQPLFHRIFRWHDAYPQYDIGHLERVAAIESALPPGIIVTGSSYRGIGIPDCVRQGQAAAQQVIAELQKQPTPQPFAVI